MKLIICSVFDAAADSYLTPFTTPTEAVAKRMFLESINDPKHQFYASPGDYTLWRLGEVDLDEGEISGKPTSMGNGHVYKKESE